MFSEGVLWQFSVASTLSLGWRKCALNKTVNQSGTTAMKPSKVTVYIILTLILLEFSIVNQIITIFPQQQGLLSASNIEYIEHVSHTLWDPMKIIEANGGIPPLTYDMFVVCIINLQEIE